jgi:hypothetical protein
METPAPVLLNSRALVDEEVVASGQAEDRTGTPRAELPALWRAAKLRRASIVRSQLGRFGTSKRLAPQSNPFAESSSPRAPKRVGALRALGQVLSVRPVQNNFIAFSSPVPPPRLMPRSLHRPFPGSACPRPRARIRPRSAPRAPSLLRRPAAPEASAAGARTPAFAASPRGLSSRDRCGCPEATSSRRASQWPSPAPPFSVRGCVSALRLGQTKRTNRPGERLPVAAILRTYKRLEPPRPEEGFAALKRDRYLE